MNPHTYGHWIFDKGAKTIQWKEDSIFNKWCWFKWWLSCTKLKSTWIKDLHVKPDTLKLIEKKVGEESQTHGHREKVSEHNTNGLFSKIKNRQMGSHKIAKLL